MAKWYWLLVVAVGAVLLLPALLAGGGFILAALLLLALLVAAVGGPKLWELVTKRNMGAKSGDRYDIRDVINDDHDRRQD